MEKDKIQSTVPDKEAIKIRRYVEMLRENGAKWEVEDVGKAIKGKILDSILGDDRNSFVFICNPETEYLMTPQNFFMNKLRALERLDIESITPETPEEIRADINALKEKLKGLDYSKKDKREEAVKLWDGFQVKVKTLVESRPDLIEAIDYSREVNGRLAREGRLK
jgi:hypothetical protein